MGRLVPGVGVGRLERLAEQGQQLAVAAAAGRLEAGTVLGKAGQVVEEGVDGERRRQGLA